MNLVDETIGPPVVENKQLELVGAGKFQKIRKHSSTNTTLQPSEKDFYKSYTYLSSPPLASGSFSWVSSLLSCCGAASTKSPSSPHPPGLFGIEIVSGSGLHDRRVLYCRSDLTRRKWMDTLRKATDIIPFDQVYTKHDLIGSGMNVRVHRCSHRFSKIEYAVKILQKRVMTETDKELLRTEIAVLKLVKHPHIVRLEDVFESRNHVYIVMELVKGGDMFSQVWVGIVDKFRFGIFDGWYS